MKGSWGRGALGRAVVGCAWALALPAIAQVQGAGATFPSKVYARWAAAYEKAGGVKVSYAPTGSGDGLKRITERQVQFGGSDTPVPDEQLSTRKLVQFPMLVGGIVPVVNLPGVGPDTLRLSGELLADLMAGRIPRWNDTRIAALNPGLSLPALPVHRVVRAEKSGTTHGFTQYLAAASPAFKREIGVSQLPAWPGEVERAEGNDGIAKAIKATPGALAYVSYDRVVQDRLAGVKLRNAAGAWVEAGEAGFRAAILQSDLARRGTDTASLIDLPGPTTWPITMTSFVLVDAEPPAADTASPALRFVYWCFMHGDDLTRGTGFAPIPVTLQARLAARFTQVKARDGKTLAYLAM